MIMIMCAEIKKFLLALPLVAGLCVFVAKSPSAAEFESVTDYYASLEKLDYKKMSPYVAEIIDRIDKKADKAFSSSDISSSLQILTDAANGSANWSTRDEKVWKNYKTTWWGMGDSYIEDISEDLKRKVKKRMADGYLTSDEGKAILDLTSQLVSIGSVRVSEALQYDKKLSKNEKRRARQERKITKGTAAALEVISGSDCPTVDLIRAKYQAGCWSCLIVEKLSSAFMTAASKAYSLSQKAGLILLGIGTMLWFAFWGLRNVSSLTQLEPGNILNELIKFGFKVALAYTFIVLGLRMVGTYFINPIMGLGAKIAEAYWDKEFEPYLEDYNWETQIDVGGLSEEEQQKLREQHAANVAQANKEKASQSLDMAKLQLSTMNEEERQKNLEEINNAARKVSISKVPQFVIYPTTGSISSEFGRREYSGCKLHAGLDISAKVGTPVVAAFDGVIGRAGWENPNNKGQGYGLRLYIQHPGNWQTVYAHLNSIVVKSGDPVRKGNIIAYTGDTGRSGGPHLHFEIRTPENRPVDPVGIADGEVNAVDYVGSRNECNNPYGRKQTRGQVSPNITPIPLSGDYVYGSEASSSGSAPDYSSLVMSVPPITYTGPTDIMSKAVMNSILGATKAIGDITSENMVLGDAIMCYASLDNGGAWHPFGHVVTNFWMWFEGMFIWCTGMLLTIAVAYYLLDLSFKIGFAVVALPIVVGLWPFDLTKDKFSICISIIAKSAATFAFLAMTTTFTVQLTDAVYSYEDADATVEEDPNAPKGLAKLYEIYDRATKADANLLKMSEAEREADINYAASKLAVFSTTFVLLLFAFLYSFKLVQATVPDLVNKFFPDKAFGNQQPMHHWATAASKWVKDQAMKPVGWARDAALYQGGKLAQNAVGKAVGGITGGVRSLAGKGKGDAKTVGGMAARGVGGAAQGAGAAMEGVGKGLQNVGRAAQGLNAVVPGLGSVVGGAISAAGHATQAAGKAAKAVGKAAKQAGDAVDKSYNEFATRNKKDDNATKPESKNNEGGGK